MKNLKYVIVGSMLLLGSPAFAAPIMDSYYGGDDHNYNDVIGSNNYFDVISAELTRNNNILTVNIHTNFAGRSDEGLFSGYTYNGNGIGYGDLFLSTNWSPYGSAPYLQDDSSNGTIWEYGLSLDNRYSDGPGIATLYQLNSGDNDANALLSEDFMSGAIYRNGQEVAVDTNSNVTAVSSQNLWTVDTVNDIISFNIDITGTALASSSAIGFHWGMTCANDVIEGLHEFDVPEPASMSLLALGLLGAMRLRKQS